MSQADLKTPFDFFWSALNEVQIALGGTKVAYGPARDAWRAHRTDANPVFTRAVPVRKIRDGDKPAWRGEYRFIGGDWRSVVNSQNLTIRFMDETSALNAAAHQRSQFIG